jgi:hypothetical protein
VVHLKLTTKYSRRNAYYDIKIDLKEIVWKGLIRFIWLRTRTGHKDDIEPTGFIKYWSFLDS